jgi:hypothetical protein
MCRQKASIDPAMNRPAGYIEALGDIRYGVESGLLPHSTFVLFFHFDGSVFRVSKAARGRGFTLFWAVSRSFRRVSRQTARTPRVAPVEVALPPRPALDRDRKGGAAPTRPPRVALGSPCACTACRACCRRLGFLALAGKRRLGCASVVVGSACATSRNPPAIPDDHSSRRARFEITGGTYFESVGG